MSIDEFYCSECGLVFPGSSYAVSMTIVCPECEETATAYKKHDD